MPRICLSYRRSDSAAIVGRIYDRLAARYGTEAVFMDVTGIPYGADFRERILKAWQGAELLIAVIGPAWFGKKAEGAARVHDRLDPVRVEIETALRQGMPVIPVLVEGASMPSHDELPRSIGKLAYRNGMPVDSSLDFEPHMQRLFTAIDRALGVEATATPGATRQDDRRLASDLPVRGKTTVDLFGSMARSGRRLAPYFLVPVVVLLLAHYLIVMKLDTDPIYLRVVATVVPFACGFLLFRNLGVGIGAATLLGFAAAIVAIAGMMTVVGLVDRHAILPQSEAGWQEVAEYLLTIMLATMVGNLLARALYSMPKRWRLF